MEILSSKIQQVLKNDIGLNVTSFIEEQKNITYKFLIKDKQFFCRTSKITPKKKGQFVTFYQRNKSGVIEPFHENNCTDFLLVFSQEMNCVFVFPKSILIKKGILSTVKKEGKRAFRIYSPTDRLTSKQAMLTQKWQSDYYYSLKSIPDKKHIKMMF